MGTARVSETVSRRRRVWQVVPGHSTDRPLSEGECAGPAYQRDPAAVGVMRRASRHHHSLRCEGLASGPSIADQARVVFVGAYTSKTRLDGMRYSLPRSFGHDQLSTAAKFANYS